MDSQKTANTLTTIAYVALAIGVIGYVSLGRLPAGIVFGLPLVLIGFLLWAILLSIADRYRGAIKKATYKRNQIIFLVLVGIIIVIGLFSTVLR